MTAQIFIFRLSRSHGVLRTFKCLMACSVTSSSFLFHSTELIKLVQMMLIMVCSERLAFFISSLVKTIIWTQGGNTAPLTQTNSWFVFNVLELLEGQLQTLQQPHLLLRVTAGHLLLELLLQLLAGTDGLLVAGEVGQLLQPGIGEVLRKMLAAPFVGRKELLWGGDI